MSPQDRRNIAILAALTFFSLILFVNKAVHIDDTLFIRAAQQIQSHPLDPYNFTVNWFGTDRPMYAVTKNPPLVSYYLALAGSVAGWSEPALHCAMMIPAIFCIIGIYILARHFCSKPFEAALISLFSPALLLSSTTLMCDAMMLCLWIWSIIFWMNGIQNRSWPYLISASFLIALSALTKYFGAALIPLLGVWTIAERKRIDSSLIAMVIPVVILAGYQWLTMKYYGHGLLFDAASYAADNEARGFTAYVSKSFRRIGFYRRVFYCPAILFAHVVEPKVSCSHWNYFRHDFFNGRTISKYFRFDSSEREERVVDIHFSIRPFGSDRNDSHFACDSGCQKAPGCFFIDDRLLDRGNISFYDFHQLDGQWPLDIAAGTGCSNLADATI